MKKVKLNKEYWDQLIPGAIFSTPYESGCEVISSIDEYGNFEAYDSDRVICLYWINMVNGVES